MTKQELQRMYEERTEYYRVGSGYELMRLSSYMAGKVLEINGWNNGSIEEDPFMANDIPNKTLAEMFITVCDYVATEIAEEGKDINAVRYALIKAIQDIKAACRKIDVMVNFKEGQSQSNDPRNIVFAVNIKYGEQSANTDLWVNVSQEKLVNEVYKELSSILYHILKAMGRNIGTESFSRFKGRVADIILSLLSRERASSYTAEQK